MDSAIANELSKLDDGIAFRASSDHFHHTWARTFYSAPELYIQPQSLEEVEKVTTLARRCRRRITTVGSGHSPSDLTCTSSWMVNLDKFNKILSVDRETGLVTMQAGIRLFQLAEELNKLGLAMPNLGSINEQSIAGAISTGTHGSTLLHSILSSSVTRLRITLSNSQTVTCSPEENEDLFRAALCSLGALGVITEITFLAVPAFSLHWQQAIYPHKHVLDTWNTNLWTQAEFVRVWWYPYTRRATVWHASKTTRPSSDLPHKPAYFDSSLGYHIYHNLLYFAQWVPRILPWVEWFISGMQFGFSTGPQTTIQAIQPSRQALLMDCLYSQTVNEWAIPLRNGPTALRRLSSWLNRLQPTDPEYVEHGIPYSAEGLWVHAPIEVRVSDTTLKLENNDGSSRKSVRPHLDTSAKDGPTLYLNATLYRPYNMDPPCLARYYQAFEYLMRELDGKPHWAKNFETTNDTLKKMYGDDLKSWLNVRSETDPEGMFVGAWHRKHILGEEQPRLALEEAEIDRKPMRKGGIEIFGELASTTPQTERNEAGESPIPVSENVSSYSSQSSFDFLNSSEAAESQHLPHTNGTKGKGLAEATEEVAANGDATEDATPSATIATLTSSISSIEAVLRDLADSQTTRSDDTAASTPDSSPQEKSEETTSVSEEAVPGDEAALVEEFWVGAAAAKAEEAAAREEAAAKEQAAKQQAAKEQAAKEAAAKEQAAKEAAAKQEAAREQAAKEAAAKEQAAKEQAAKEQAAKEQAAKEQAAKEQAAKEEAARKEQAEKEEAAQKAEAAAKERAAKEEQAAKEAAAQEQAVREEVARKVEAARKEQAAKEQAAKEQAAKEQAAKEEAARKEASAKEQAAKEAAAKEQAAKEEAARKEQAEKEEAARKAEAAVKEQAAKEQAAKEQAMREEVTRKVEAALKERAAKEQAAKEQAAKEQAAKEQAAKQEAARKEQAAKEQAAKELAAKEQAAKEAAAKEQAAKEASTKEQAAKEQAAKEQAAKEDAARKQEAAKEVAARKEKAAKEQAAKEQAAKESAIAKKTAAEKITVTAKESTNDSEQKTNTQQAQQNDGTKPRRLSFAKVAALTPEEAPKSTEPAAPVLDLHHLPPSPPKTNGRHFLPLQSRQNGLHAKSKTATKEAGSPKAAKKEQQSQTTDAAASPKQAKKEQQSNATDPSTPPSKREAFDPSTSTRAAKRAKLAELAEQFDHGEQATATQKETVPPPVARPNSLDELLEEQAKAREGKHTAGAWRPQVRPNSLDELLEEQAKEREGKSAEGGWRPQLRANS